VSNERGESVDSSEGGIATGIVDIRTSATGGIKGVSRGVKKGQNISNSVVFDEKQMMSVKVMRNTLEKG
jgi:pseudouridine-5'-phosphate glycosidase